jgi:phosphatidate cytidylyltransferase
MARSELAERVAVAALGVPVAVAAVYWGGWVLGAVLAAVAAGGAYELYRLATYCGVRPFVLPGALTAGLLVLIAAGRPDPLASAPLLWSLLLVLLLGTAIAAIFTHGADGHPLPAVSVTVAGALLTGGTLAYALYLRHLPGEPLAWAGAGLATRDAEHAAWVGRALVAYPLVLTWVNDSFAFFGGRLLGRRRLAPRVSPGKTVAGALVGLIGTVFLGTVYAALVFWRWLDVPIGLVAAVVGAVVISVIAQLGDLAESLLKREAGVKDSGRVFRGHGGILDRFDALFFTIPVAYWYLALVLRSGGGSWL